MTTQTEPAAAPLTRDRAAERASDGPQPIRLPPDWALTDERFLEIARLNPDQMLERTADGKLHQMIWPDNLGVRVTTRIAAFVTLWSLEAGGDARGEAGGYFLSDGSAPAPDVSWVPPEQTDEHGGDTHYHLAPAFVVEVISSSQSVPAQQSKLRSWIDNGVRLGWLIDPRARTIWVYRANGEVEQLDNPSELSGEDVCAGLTIDMSLIWEHN